MTTNMPKQFFKSTLSELYTNNSSLLKNRLSNKAVNDIKYSVLQENNLGKKNYEYTYTYVNNPSDEYFEDILTKLQDVFPDSEISYTVSSLSNNTSITVLFNHPELKDENSEINFIPSYSFTRITTLYSNILDMVNPPPTDTDTDTNTIIKNTITINWK